MSKRFGRNQKNALRREIATLKAKLKTREAYIAAQDKALQGVMADNRSLVESILSIQPNSALVPAQSIGRREPPITWLIHRQTSRVPVFTPTERHARDGSISFADEVALTAEISVDRLVLDEIRVEMDRREAGLRLLIHVRAGDRCAAYCVSPEVIRHVRDLPLVAGCVASDILRLLSQEAR